MSDQRIIELERKLAALSDQLSRLRIEHDNFVAEARGAQIAASNRLDAQLELIQSTGDALHQHRQNALEVGKHVLEHDKLLCPEKHFGPENIGLGMKRDDDLI